MGIKSSLHRWRAAHKGKEAPQKPALKVPAEGPEDPRRGVALKVPDEVEPEIVAVIAAVLAIEVKMFLALQGQRFTFRRDAQSQGWSEWGRLLAHPFQGVTRP